MVFDERTEAYFDRKIKQVFVYLTSRCQLRCRQCLYKPLLCEDSGDPDYFVLTALLQKFFHFGAYKISFLGGEPTLYHDKKNHKKFGDIVEASKKIGYRYVRVDTNGQFAGVFLEEPKVRILDEITFSLDGHDEKTNDAVRGQGTYRKCLENIENAVRTGCRVHITSCVHKYSCPEQETGFRNLMKLIGLAEKLGVASINFHPIVKAGIARDAWIEDTDISPEVWQPIYKKLINLVLKGHFHIKVRLPMRFIQQEKILSARSEYLYCPLEMGERALIMPDGQIKVCAFTIGTPKCVARYNASEVHYEENNNEREVIGTLDENAVCYSQHTPYSGLVPLCMSYKPYQSEPVWEEVTNG